MGDLPGNPFSDEGRLSLPHAMLALVYEKRTANLIALAACWAEYGGAERGEEFLLAAEDRVGGR
jgi:hypothetical protein